MRGSIIVNFIVIMIFIQILYNTPQLESTTMKDTPDTKYLENAVTQIDPQELLSNTPTAFTENRGQLENDEVRFYAQGGNVWFTDDGVWFELREEIKSQESGVEGRESDEWLEPRNGFKEPEAVEYRRVVLKQEFVGEN